MRSPRKRKLLAEYDVMEDLKPDNAAKVRGVVASLSPIGSNFLKSKSGTNHTHQLLSPTHTLITMNNYNYDNKSEYNSLLSQVMKCEEIP